MANSYAATVGGGMFNEITNAFGATIAGGTGNEIQFEGNQAAIGGGSNNRIEMDAQVTTIAGGQGNLITLSADYAAIGGGRENVVQGGFNSVIGGGWKNLAGADDAAILGGNHNTNLALRGAIGGGLENLIQFGAHDATLAGGAHHTVGNNATYAAVGGGLQNTVSANADYATVPGGRENQAGGDYTLAAGRRAKANHQGTFAWADSQDADFASTGNNQFLIRASGGVGINKNNPGTALDVNGTVTATAFVGNGAGLTGVTATLADGSVTTAKLADNSVTSAKIADGNVATADLADGAVTSAKVGDGSIANADLANDAVTSVKLANDAASLAKVSAGAVSSAGGNVSVTGNLSVGGTISSSQGSKMQINPLHAKAVDGGVTLTVPADDYGAIRVSAAAAGTYRVVVPLDIPLQMYGRKPAAWSVTCHYAAASVNNFITRTRLYCSHPNAGDVAVTEDTTDRTSFIHSSYTVNGPSFFNEEWRSKAVEFQVTLTAGASLRLGSVIVNYTY